MRSLLVGGFLAALGTSQSCDLSDSSKSDCGYVGIDQSKCQAKGCCWKPVSFLNESNDTPWCYFPKNELCNTINLDGSKGMGFNDSFYNSMYTLFDANINIQGLGGIVAAPDHSTPGGSYYYHWMRDGALTMRTYMELNNYSLSKVQEKMNAFVGWVSRTQKLIDPNGFDIRINPKFELPNGAVYIGGWCRPQTDGPGLQSAALITYANILLSEGKESYVKETIVPLIKYDLDWVHNNWQSEGCDLWEEAHSNDFFWNRMSYVYTMDIAKKFFQKINDAAYSSKCDSTKTAVRNTLDNHWTGEFMYESTNRKQDGATIHAFSSFEAYAFTDQKIAKTIKTLALTFCQEYKINQKDNENKIPGILIGRYPGDVYAGGNPWQLLTAVTAKTFYQGATALLNSNGFKNSEDQSAWAELLNLEKNAGTQEFAEAIVSAGDAIMYRLYEHVKSGNGHIDEQIGKESGLQASAKDLTWSFANILSAMQQRKASVMLLEQKFSKTKLSTE